MLAKSPESRPTYFDDVLEDPEIEGLSLYEKKALIVNRELDSYGMGTYQVRYFGHNRLLGVADHLEWYIFFLSGFGYLLDLLFAHAFALVAPALQQELGFSSAHHQSPLQFFGLTFFQPLS